MQRLNPAQFSLLERHVERAVQALEEADRLLKGQIADVLAPMIRDIRALPRKVDHEEVETVEFELEEIPLPLIAYLENPFAQSLSFNLYCIREGLSHTRAKTEWEGGTQAAACRNLIFLPTTFQTLWEDGLVDRTRLIHIADRALNLDGYNIIADMLESRGRQEVDDFLNRTPVQYLRVGRRGPEQALEAAEELGWMDELETVKIAKNLIAEAEERLTDHDDEDVEEEEPWMDALRELRSGLNGADVAEEVIEGLKLSPNPMALVEKFLTEHRKSGDVDPMEVSKTLFFAHAGPISKLIADDKMLLRVYEPIKTQKRGQLFYKILQVTEEVLQERMHKNNLDARGMTEEEAIDAVRKEVSNLNSDPNRWLDIPEQWLGEVTRRHLYYGSRTRKDGSAYKWFRKIDGKYFLGGHKTQEELDEREARRKERGESN